MLSSALTQRELETLASHLTVGETYFFREKSSLEVFEQQIVPELIRTRRGFGVTSGSGAPDAPRGKSLTLLPSFSAE